MRKIIKLLKTEAEFKNLSCFNKFSVKNRDTFSSEVTNLQIRRKPGIKQEKLTNAKHSSVINSKNEQIVRSRTD